MPNCTAPISKNQKKLLKIITCLFNQYIVCHTPATKAFMADPSNVSLLNNMNVELTGLLGSIYASNYIKCLSTVNIPVHARIVVYGADGKLTYDSDKGLDALSTDNYGTLKGTQVLNVDECQEVVYQIKPGTYSDKTSLRFGQVITEAGAYERIGCPGVSNTGFLRLTLEVDIDYFPFNPCYCDDCKIKSSSCSSSSSSTSCSTPSTSSSSTCKPKPKPKPKPKCCK